MSGQDIHHEMDPDFWFYLNYVKSMFALHPVCDLSERFSLFIGKIHYGYD